MKTSKKDYLPDGRKPPKRIIVFVNHSSLGEQILSFYHGTGTPVEYVRVEARKGARR